MQTIDYDQLAANQAAADEIKDPGCTARKAAARERERIIREAHATTERQYKELLTLIVQGQKPDPVELTRLATALGRSEKDISDDIEMRAAELADLDEAQRVANEKAELEQLIAQQDALIEQSQSEQAKAVSKCKTLEAAIWKLYEPVAVKEKAALKKAQAVERSAAAGIQQATDNIHQLQAKLQNVRPGMSQVERLRKARFQAKHEAKQKEHERAMAPYVFAGQQDSLPDDVMRSVISPTASDDPPTQEPGRSVRLGMVDGKEVVVSVAKLG
jgi:hypothetical protein